MHELLGQLLVNVPYVATLNFPQVIIQLSIFVLTHIVLSEKICNKGIAYVVVCFEICDELGACRWKLIKDLACHGVLVAVYKHVLVMIGEYSSFFAASLLKNTVVIDEREIFSELRDSCHSWQDALAVYNFN